MQKVIVILLLLFNLTATHVLATNYYVSALIGNNSFSGTSPLAPFATLPRAHSFTNPGDTVFAMNGTYSSSPDGVVIVRITRSGTAAQPIVYKNFSGHTPFIDFNVWTAIKVTGGASYIVIDGFKIRGNNRNIVLSDALNQPGSCANTTGSPNPIFNGSGIDVSGNTHHVVVRNCEVYECGGTGIGTGFADYVTIENNLVYNNCWYSKYGNSGISMNESWDYDNNTTNFKMIIRNNIVYGNRLYVPWRSGTICQGITDGNGIILDINQNTGYLGKFLVENNVVYRNGGRGIHVYKSDNATVRNNSTFKNCASPELSEGEITVITASNVEVYNNIMYARDGERVNTLSGFTNFSNDNNILFNSNLRGYYSTNDMITDPLYTDTLNNNFTLVASSPAINAGSNLSGTFSATDILGVVRPMGALPDLGAYEFTGTPSIAGNFTINNLAVVRAGDGSSALNTNGAAVNVIEYTTAGVPTGVNVVLSDGTSTAPNRLILSGDNTSGEGQLSLSSDGRYLTLTGYEGAIGSTAATYQANDKIVTRIANNAVADFSTRISVVTFNQTIRSTLTENSSLFYIAGSSVSPASANSTRFLSYGAPVTTTATTAFITDMRSLKIFKDQVYCARGNTVATLTPNPASGNYATKTDLPGVSLVGHNFQSFAFLDIDATFSYLNTGYDVLYCADQTLGLLKFFWNGTSWLYAGAFNPTSATGVTGGLQDITARVNGAGNPELYVVKGAASNNNIIAITDGSGRMGNIGIALPSAVNVVAAGTNYMFRGLAFTPARFTQTFTWTGAVNTDWNNAQNWVGNTRPGVSPTEINITIPTGLTNYPVIPVGTSVALLGGTVAINANMILNGGITILSGANVNINGSLTVGSSGNIIVNGSLNNNGSLTLKSSATGTASIGQSAGFINDNAVTVERFLPMLTASSSRRWRLLGVPISANNAPSINAAWQEGQTSANRLSPVDNFNPFGTAITNGTVSQNGFDQGTTSSSSIYKMEPGSGAWSVPASTTGVPVTNFNGYMLFVRGNRSIVVSNQFVTTSGAANLRIKGKINIGNVSVPVVTGRQIVCNPYPSAISMNSVTYRGALFNSVATNTYYLWDPLLFGSKGAGAWVTFQSKGDNATYTIVPNPVDSGYMSQYTNGGVLESGVAFMLDAPSASTMAFTEGAKVTGSSSIGFASRPMGAVAELYINLACRDTSGRAILSDGVAIMHNSDFNNEVDAQDAGKLLTFQTREKIGLLKNGNLLSIERRQNITAGDTVFLQLLKLDFNATYQLQFKGNRFAPSLSTYLVDRYLDSIYQVAGDGITRHNFTTNGNAASFDVNRFVLVFKQFYFSTLPVRFIAINASWFRNKTAVNVEWKTADEINIHQYLVEKAMDGIHFETVASVVANRRRGIYNWIDNEVNGSSIFYRIVSTGNTGERIYSKITEVSNASLNKISLLNNPLKGGMLNVQLKNMAAGKYYYKLLNSVGQIVLQKELNYAGGTAVVEIAKVNGTGHYLLQIITPNYSCTTLKFLKE